MLEAGLARADKALRLLGDQLPAAVMACIEAAGRLLAGADIGIKALPLCPQLLELVSQDVFYPLSITR
jgi:hypothetical protein